MNAAGAMEAAPLSVGWEASRWERILHDGRTSVSALGAAERSVSSAVLGAVREFLPEGVSEELAGELVRSGTEALGRGIFGRLYGDPVEAEEGPAWARAAAKAIASSQGFDDLRAGVAGDPDMAAIASAELLRGVADQVGGIVESLLEDGEDPIGDLEGDEDDLDVSGAAGKLRGRIVKSIRAVADAREALNGLLPGLGSAPSAPEQEDPRRLQLVERLRGNDRLRRILAVAGRIRRIAERVRRTRSDDAREEVVDVERGADLGRVLPSELAGLKAGGGRRALVLKGIADRGLLQYRLSGTEPLGKGPFVALLDASYSMDKPLADGLRRIDWAAAIGIAIVRAGVEQGRDVAIAAFDDGVLERWTYRVPAGDRRAAEAAVLGLATLGPCGGTVFDPAIAWALDGGAERARADLILVTDGAGIVSEALVARLDASRSRGLRLWGILAGEGAVPATVARLADGIVSLGRGDSAEQIGGLGAT